MSSPQYRPALFLALVALAALGVTLMLALTFAPRSSAQPPGTTAAASIVAPTAEPAAPSRPPSLVDEPPLLWTVLAPLALVVDAMAVLGMAAVLALRHGVRCRRRARM